MLIAACSKPSPEVRLPPQNATEIMEWDTIVRGMRLDLVDDSGKVVRERVSIHELLLAGQPTIVALWASYCPPCLEEMPMFEDLSDDGHQVLGVSLDAANFEGFTKVLEEESPDYPQAILQTWSLKRLSLALDSGVPFTIVLNRRGNVRYLFRGKTTKDALLTALERLRS